MMNFRSTTMVELLHLSQECKLYMNSIYNSTTPHRHTWYSPTGFTKRVDYILTEWHVKQLSYNCRVYLKASVPFEIDHRFLALSRSFPSKRQQNNVKGPLNHTQNKIAKKLANVNYLDLLEQRRECKDPTLSNT